MEAARNAAAKDTADGSVSVSKHELEKFMEELKQFEVSEVEWV